MKYSHQNLFVIICRLPASKKVFLQLEHHIELMLHLQNQYLGLRYLEMSLVASNAYISPPLFRPV